MKKLIILVAAFTIGGTMASCKKDYVCKCTKTYTRSNGSTESDPDGQYTFKDTAPRATDRCNKEESSGEDVLRGPWTRDCEIQ